MAQTALLIKTLKTQLKTQGKTYRDVGAVLGLSEASVKRLFAEQHFTLERLERVAQLVGLELSDLFQLMVLEQQTLEQLSYEQEQSIANDLLLLMVAISVLNGFSYQDLLEQYQLDPHQCVQKLAQLDRMGLIELQLDNRIKLLVAPNFHWRINGPIQRFFQTQVVNEFFNSKFDQPTEYLLVRNGLLSDGRNKALQDKMLRLAQEFSDAHSNDKNLPLCNKFGTTMVIALRQWQFSGFNRGIKKDC